LTGGFVRDLPVRRFSFSIVVIIHLWKRNVKVAVVL
jgi:hypothetical protein